MPKAMVKIAKGMLLYDLKDKMECKVILAEPDRFSVEYDYGSAWHGIPVATFDSRFVDRKMAEIQTLVSLIWKEGCILRVNPKINPELPNNDDEMLVKSWSIEDSSVNRLLSARMAEKAVIIYFKRLGYIVEDVSILQVNAPSDVRWKDFDLLSGKECIDVKNARSFHVNNGSYVDHCVPRFKKDRRGKNVLIAGALSVAQNLDSIRRGQSCVQFLGLIDESRMNCIRNFFNGHSFDFSLTDDLRGPKFLPPWIFAYPMRAYEDGFKSLEELRRVVKDYGQVIRLNAPGHLPPLIAAGLNIVEFVDFDTDWKRDFALFLQRGISEVGRSLPVLYLSILEQFVRMMVRADCGDYQPLAYRHLIFFNDRLDWPMLIYDPLKTIDRLITNLQTLWDNRNSQLEQIRHFQLRDLNILRGRKSPGDSWLTVLAYCGGWIDNISGGRPCGNSLLVYGTCSSCSCGKLICPECGYCSGVCKEFQIRRRNK